MDGKLRNMTTIYILRNEKVLLLYRQGGRVVNNVWTGSAGGHFEEDELNDATACVLREMKEELGLMPEDTQNLRLRYVTLRSTKGEIRQNYYFFADLNASVPENLPSNEGITQWFPLEAITQLEMPFTAQYVMNHYLQTGRLTSTLYVGVAAPGGVTFCPMIES